MPRFALRCLFLSSLVAAAWLLSMPATAQGPSLSVVRTSAPRFYANLKAQSNPKFPCEYASYKVTNSGAPVADLWVSIGDFTGNVVLSDNAPSTYQIGALGTGETKPCFFYLKGTGYTAAASNHNLKLYSGNPSRGGVQIGTPVAFSLASVEEVLDAAANKVTGATVVFNPAELGQPITIRVTGESGTIGAGMTLNFTPASLPTWPAGSFKLVSTTLTLNGTVNKGSFDDQLYIGVTDSSSTPYVAEYRFKATGTTDTPTPIYPLAHISSGAQTKHTDPGSLGSLPAIPPVINAMSLTVSASPTTQQPGGTITYTVTASNTGQGSMTLDAFTVVLANGFSYVPGTSQYAGVPIANPTVNGQTLTWPGPFTIAAGTNMQLLFNVTSPVTTGTYATSVQASALLQEPPGVQIDATANTYDNAPAAAAVVVKNLDPPNITSINPATAAVGATVTMTGNGFTGVDSVNFNGAAATFTVVSDTRIDATVPNGATTGDVAVTNAAGTANKPFTVIPAPTITSFDPVNGIVGTIVTITGTNFTGATSVKFGGTAATTFTVDSATQITATLPDGAATGKVSVTTPGGTATSAANFTVTGAPVITNLAPGVGVPGTTVVITGTDFKNVTSVKFGTLGAASYTVDSETQITAVVPNGATTAKVSVTTNGGTGLSANNFVVPAPGIDGFNPTSGFPGQVVIIAGSNFTGATAVKFNGTDAASFTVDNNGQITATAPNGVTSGTITVTTPAGTAVSGGAFVVPTPVITDYAPKFGVAGNTVILTGSNFTQASEVKFGGVAATAFTVDSDNQITVTVPNGAASGAITVTGPGGTGSTAGTFAILGAPTITAVNPVGALPGAVVTITGTGFTGATGVKFNGTDATAFTVVDDTTITATVPNGASTGQVQVVGPGGNALSVNPFTVLGAPTITGVNPPTGGRATTVTITGTNFTGATSVTIGGVAVTFTVVNDTTITAVIGDGVTGKVEVTTPNGKGTSALNVTVTTQPVISGYTTSGSGAQTTITITGSNFTGATGVTIGGQPVTSFTVLNDSTIIAVVGQAVTGGQIVVTTAGGTAAAATSFTLPVISGIVAGVSGGSFTLQPGSNSVGSFTVQNTGTVVQTLTQVTVVFSNPSLFSSATMTATAGGVSVTATLTPGSTSLFVFSSPLTLQPGQVATLTLDLVRSATLGSAPTGTTRSDRMLALVSFASAAFLLPLLGAPMRRRAATALVALVLLSSLTVGLTGCGGGGGGGGSLSTGIYQGPAPSTSTIQVTRVSGRDINGQSVDYQGVPVELASVNVVN